MRKKKTLSEYFSDLVYIFRYYWFFIMGGAALLAALTGILITFLTQDAEPDYTVAVMTSEQITDEELRKMEAAFASGAEDLNHDGTVWVQCDLFAYAVAESEEEENQMDAYQSVANTVWFQNELFNGSSVIYIVKPYTYDTLCKLDNTFFTPVSQVIDGVKTDTVPIGTLIPGDSVPEALRSGYSVAVHKTEDLSGFTSSVELLEQLLNSAEKQ